MAAAPVSLRPDGIPLFSSASQEGPVAHDWLHGLRADGLLVSSNPYAEGVHMKSTRKVLWRRAGLACLVATPVLTYIACQGQEEKANNKIFGGFEVTDESTFGPLLESTVAITDSFSLFRGKSFCSGTLIGQNTVLTAAHCFTDDNGNQNRGEFYVFFGNKVGQNGRVDARQIVQIERHPGYDHRLTVLPQRQSRNAHDIALVKFAGEAPEGYKPAQLAPSDASLPRQMVLAGYGTTGTLLKTSSGALARGRDGQPVSQSDTGTLRAARVALSRAFTGGSVFFMVSPNGKPQGACPGDSGGPAYYQVGQDWFVGGALSTGLTGLVDLNGDGTADANCRGENFYTDVRPYADYIAEVKKKFGDVGQQPEPEEPEKPIEEPEEPTEPEDPTPVPDLTGKVYWVTSTVSREFAKKTGLVTLHLFNDTAQPLKNCSAEADLETVRPFFFWLITMRDAITSNSVASIDSRKLGALTLDLTKLSDWQRRQFRRVQASLTCDGRKVPLQTLELNSLPAE